MPRTLSVAKDDVNKDGVTKVWEQRLLITVLF